MCLLYPLHKPQGMHLSNIPIYHFVTEMCTCEHISVTIWYIAVYFLERIVGFVRWCRNLETLTALLACVKGIHQPSVMRGFDIYLIVSMDKLLKK